MANGYNVGEFATCGFSKNIFTLVMLILINVFADIGTPVQMENYFSQD